MKIKVKSKLKCPKKWNNYELYLSKLKWKRTKKVKIIIKSVDIQ